MPRKTKSLTQKLRTRRQTGSSKTSADKARKAKRPGWRTSRSGNPYYETRRNRSDRPGKRI